MNNNNYHNDTFKCVNNNNLTNVEPTQKTMKMFRVCTIAFVKNEYILFVSLCKTVKKILK